MAKELPYFKFEPAEYLTKNISFCSLSAQGLFVNICSYYWQRNCKLTTEQVLKRLNYKTELDELISEGIIDLQDDFIVIKFLDNQLVEVEKTSKQNAINGAKGGRPKKQKESENKPTALIPLSETKGIREDKIKEDKIKEDKINNNNFVVDCLSSEQWIEVLAMKLKCNVGKIKHELSEFENHLIILGDQKKYLDDFKSHFINWLNKRPKEKVLTKRQIS